MSLPRAVGVAAVCVTLAAGAWAASTLRVTTDVGGFLPEGNADLARVSRSLASSSLARMWLFTVEGTTPDRSTALAGELGTSLARLPEVASAQARVEEGMQEALYRAYFPHRFAMADPQPERLAERLSDAGLTAAAVALRDALAGPLGPLVRRIAPEDPLLLFPALLARAQSAGDGFTQGADGGLQTADGRRGVLVVRTRSSAFDAAATRRIEAAVARFTAAVAARGERVIVAQSALHRHAARTEESMRADMTRISIGSLVATVLLFAWAFRSPRPFFLSLVPMLLGLAGGMLAVRVGFREVHGMTLAFGASLAGVCVDYAVHWLVHVGADASEAHRRSARGAILLGAFTTLAGLAAFAGTSFAGMREIAVFASVAVLVAVTSTLVLLPSWASVDSSRILEARVAPIAALIERLRGHRGVVTAGLVSLALPAFGVARLHWADGVDVLQRPHPVLQREDEAVRADLGRHDTGRLVVASASTLEAALAVNGRVSAALATATRDGALGGYRSLDAFLWSAEAQRANLAAFTADPTLDGRLGQALAGAGFVPGSVRSVVDAARATPGPVTWEALATAGLGEWLAPFRLEGEGRTSLLTFLREVRDEGALRACLAPLGDAVAYLDQRAFLSAAYGAFRERVLGLLLFGVVIIVALVAARYRTARGTLVAVAPGVLAVTVVFGVLGLAGAPANVLHLLGGLLVLSMGVDYGVFVAEDLGGAVERLARTALSVGLSCATTVASFGLLALSEEPPLRSIGVSIALGLPLAACFAIGGFIVFGRGARGGGAS